MRCVTKPYFYLCSTLHIFKAEIRNTGHFLPNFAQSRQGQKKLGQFARQSNCSWPGKKLKIQSSTKKKLLWNWSKIASQSNCIRVWEKKRWSFKAQQKSCNEGCMLKLTPCFEKKGAVVMVSVLLYASMHRLSRFFTWLNVNLHSGHQLPPYVDIIQSHQKTLNFFWKQKKLRIWHWNTCLKKKSF